MVQYKLGVRFVQLKTQPMDKFNCEGYFHLAFVNSCSYNDTKCVISMWFIIIVIKYNSTSSVNASYKYESRLLKVKETGISLPSP